jgi:hypothetical protein
MTVFWTTKPGNLISSANIKHVWPTRTMPYVEKLNAITRLTIVLTVLAFALTGSIRSVVAGSITILLVVLIHSYYMRTGHRLFDPLTKGTTDGQSRDVEGFRGHSREKTHIANATDLSASLGSQFSNPTPTNPMSNVLLTDIEDNPDKKSAPPAYQDKVYADINSSTVDMVKQSNKDFPGIEDKLFGSLGEKFDFDMSMRQFHSTPNTRVSNDQGAFAQFCYGNMTSCKDGDVLMCSSNDHTRIS